MFRKMRRYKQELPHEECVQLLKTEPRGVLAVYGEDGYPYAVPMNFILLGEKLYFHMAGAGHKVDAMRADNRVSFCVMDKGFKKDGEWALNIKSVIIFGRMNEVTDRDRALEIIRKLGLKYYPSRESVEDEIKKAFASAHIYELTVDHMTGKLVNES